MPTIFDDLVEEVLHEVARWLTRARDHKNFGLLSRGLWSILAPSLYSDLEFHDHDWVPCIAALQAQPQLVRHVRSLRLHAENMSESRAYPLSSILAELVVSMPNLEVFVWDLPWAMDEGLWEALKPDVCPHLRTLGVFCSPGPVPQHHMSAFAHIRSLHVRADEDADASLELWRALRDAWAELEELVLVGRDGAIMRQLVHRVLAERWPRLRQLAIGEIALDAPFVLSFMQAHPDLEELRLCGDVSPPDGGQVIPSSLLLHLRVFQGTLWHATLLAGHGNENSIRSLHITDHLSERLRLSKPMGITLASLFSRTPRLTHLRLEFACDGASKQLRNLRTILGACAQLRALDLALTGLPFVALAKMASMLGEAVPLLARLSLSLVPVSREVDVGAGAYALAAFLPHLRELQVQHLAPEAWREPPRELGEYEVLPGVCILTLFEGTLVDVPVTQDSEASGRLRLDQPDPALYRRHFAGRGWRWYIRTA